MVTRDRNFIIILYPKVIEPIVEVCLNLISVSMNRVVQD